MADDPHLGMRVAQLAESHVGERVGNGECFDFPDYVLKAAGASSARDYGKVTPHGNYVWGKPVNVFHIRAGDIIQYKDFRLTQTTTVVTTSLDGTTTSTPETKTVTADQHTAIVKEVLHDGTVTLYEQYVDGAKFVQVNNIPIRSKYMKDRKKVGDTTTTVEVKIKGSFTVYRPQSKKP